MQSYIMSYRLLFYFEVLIIIFYFSHLTNGQNCDDEIEVKIEDQDTHCAQHNTVINITVTTPDIELQCPDGYNINLDTVALSTQVGKNTIVNGGHMSIQALRYGHTGEYYCVMDGQRISIRIQATGVGMILRDRTNNGVIEFHQVVNNSVVYLSCKKDFGILFICESSYQNERFALTSSGVFTPTVPPAKVNEFEIGSNGVLNGDETILTCEPKDELGIVRNIIVTVKVTERLPGDDCDGIFPKTSQPSENTACVLELGTNPIPVIQCTDCNSDWEKMDGICYRAFNTNFNWSEAQANCVSEGGYLAEIPNYYVNKIVNNERDGHECWIGLRRDMEGGYEWRSGRKVNESEFSAWKNGDVGIGSGGCGVMSSEFGEWELKQCDEVRQCSICMRGTINPPPFPEPQDSCNNGVVIENRCYQFFSINLPWQFAQRECELLGSNLIEIPNQNISSVIPELSPSGEFWIGLRRGSRSAEFRWRSGRALEYYGFNMWSDGHPSDQGDCVSASQNGMWQDKPCSEKLGYICQNGTFNISAQTIQTSSMISHTSTHTYSPSTASPVMLTMTPGVKISGTTTVPILTSSLISPTPVYTIESTVHKTESTPTTPTKSTSTSVGNPVNNINSEKCDPSDQDKTCEILKENLQNYLTVSNIKTDDIISQLEMNLMDLISNIPLNFTGAVHIEINDATLVLVSIPSDASSINLTSTVSLSTTADSFPGGVLLAALVKPSDSEAYVQTLTYPNTMEFISDICTLVANTELSGNVSLIFSYNSSMYGLNVSISCAFYNTSDSVWSSEGITTVVKSGSVVECITNHFTSFAVLVTFKSTESEPDEVGRTIQGYLSMGLCIISLIFLLLSLAFYACVGKKFFSRDLNIIHLNYILALIFALVSFLLYSILFATNTELEADNPGCMSIAFVNHYFWLSVFSWNFCEALHIILALYSHKVSNRKHYWWLMIIGWGFPVPIVIITLAAAFSYYTNANEKVCFLNYERGVISAFLAPIYLIVLINSCILIFVVVVTVYVQRKRKNKRYILSLICGTATTLPLLGLPWVAGILPNLSGLLEDDNIAWLNYIFIILNASQGIIFFCIHVIRNDQVLDKLCNLSLPETNEDKEKSENKNINTYVNAPKKISKGMRTPDAFSNTTEAGNYLTQDSSTFITEKIGDLPSYVAIENPTYANSLPFN